MAAIAAAAIAGSATVVWHALRLVARVARPDDDRTVCGASRLGTICKLSFLLGHPMPLLEAARFAFFPAADDDDPSRRDPDDDGGIHSVEDMRAARSSDTLVVAFAGGATNRVGFPRREFRRMLSRPGTTSRNADQLHVLDPTGMSFYEHDVDAFRTNLAAILRPYRRVVFVGNCMGATGALRFATLLRHDRDAVVAFNPEVNPADDPRLLFRIAAFLMPATASRLRGILNDAITETPARIRIHASTWPPERAQAMMLLSPSEKGAAGEMDANDTSLHTANDRAGGMMVDAEYRDYVAAGGEAADPPPPRLLRIAHGACAEHGLLAKRLKPNGSLRRILDDAVGGPRAPGPGGRAATD